MTALAIIIALFILFSLLRFGVSVEYSADGITVSARAGPLSLCVYPRKAKPKKKKEKPVGKVHKEKRPREKKEKPEKKPGGWKALLEMLPAIKNTLSRLRRRLLIKMLTIHFIAAGEDPSRTAMLFGASNAAFAVVVPVLESSFRIRRRDLKASADFEAAEAYIYIKAAVSLAVWEAFYIVFAVVPALIRMIKNQKA